MQYYERIREVCKELIDEGENVNASNLYKRILPMYKNMPKKMRDDLDPVQSAQRSECLHILLLNIALCHLKRDQFRDAVKFCKEAIDHNSTNPKAFFRLAVAQRQNGELEPAKVSILAAIKLSPNDPKLREEYKILMELMNKKHKEWFQKMNGFMNTSKMREIEEQDKQE